MKFLEKDEWPEFETEQYRDCIIDTFTYSNHHIVVSYPFVFFIDYFNLDDEVFYELIEPSTESYLDSINRIKDRYYQACRELYGEKEATRKLEKLLRCEKAKNDYYAKFDETRITLEKILQYAQDEKKQVVLSPDIRIICAESSDYAYRTLTEEINRIKETFKQNGFSSKSKDVHIVLLTDSIFRDNKTVEEVNRVTTSPKNAIFIGSGLTLDKNDIHQLKQWVENQTYYSYLLNIISDKETIALKLFALLNGWEGADSDGSRLWQLGDNEQV